MDLEIGRLDLRKITRLYSIQRTMKRMTKIGEMMRSQADDCASSEIKKSRCNQSQIRELEGRIDV